MIRSPLCWVRPVPAGTPVDVASGHPLVDVVVAKVILLLVYAAIGDTPHALIVPERMRITKLLDIAMWKWSIANGFFETTPGHG